MTFKPHHVIAAVAVAPSDDMQLAERVVDAAVDIVKSAGAAARITLLYVHSRRPLIVGADTGFTPPSYYEAIGQLDEQTRAFAGEALAKLKLRVEQRDVSVSLETVDALEGTGDAIAAAAERAGADAIVLCSHGRRGLKRVLLGSVAGRVTNVATLPVVVLRPHD